MSKQKFFFAISSFFVWGVLGLGFKVLAADDAIDRAIGGLGTTASGAGLPVGVDPYVAIGQMLSYVLGFASIILLIMVVYGGITWMTAGGNEEQVSKGRRMITQAVIGLLVTISSFSVVNYMVGRMIGGQVQIIEQTPSGQ